MKKNRDEINLNFIEHTARKMGGRDEESLLRQMEEARQEWEWEKRENPEEAAAVERSADQQFAAIMARLKAENVQPVSREEYEKRKKEGEKEHERERGSELPVREAETAEEITDSEEVENGSRERVAAVRKKKYRKVVVIAAVAAVLMVGMSVVAIGRPEYHTVYPENWSDRNDQIKYNSTIRYRKSQWEEAYQDMKESLEMPIMTLGYFPDELELEDVIITDREGILKFSYGDKWLYLKGKKELLKNNLNVLTSDRRLKETIHNDWLDVDFLLEENILNDDTIEYSIAYETEEASYYLSAIVEKSVFVEIAENLIITK